MAEDKKSIVVYADWKNIFEELENEEAGKLIKHFFRYVNDLNPEPPDRLTKLLFEPIKQTLKRDLVKYEIKREKNRQNALLRWEKENATVCDGIKLDANHADSVSVSDSDIIKEKTWRNDFQIYLSECKKGYADFMTDEELLKTQQRLNPGVNIKLSIEKGFVNFWGTEAGWEYKKKKRSKVINWKSTIVNSISMNKVYLPKQ